MNFTLPTFVNQKKIYIDQLFLTWNWIIYSSLAKEEIVINLFDQNLNFQQTLVVDR